MPIRLVALGLLVPLLVSCAQNVPEAGVEDRTRELLAEMHDDVGDVDCPSDLDAEVGATMECAAIIGGVERGLTIEVTEVEDDTAQWRVDVKD